METAVIPMNCNRFSTLHPGHLEITAAVDLAIQLQITEIDTFHLDGAHIIREHDRPSVGVLRKSFPYLPGMGQLIFSRMKHGNVSKKRIADMTFLEKLFRRMTIEPSGKPSVIVLLHCDRRVWIQ